MSRFLLIVLFLFPFPMQAQAAAELKDVVATLEEGYKNMEDVTAHFSQRTLIASMKREEKGSGELFIKKPADAPAMFRFNYLKPRKQQIISNGKTVWLYTPENRQVMVMDIAELMEGGPGGGLNYLTGLGKVSRDFKIAFAGEGQDKNGDYVLLLVPRKRSRVIARLIITVSSEAVERFLAGRKASDLFPVKTSVLFDNYGNRTALEFTKIKTNSDLGVSLFTFTPPPGVEVIKQ